MEQEQLQEQLAQARRELEEATARMNVAMSIHSKKLERRLSLQEQATREAVAALDAQLTGGLR